MDYDIDNIFSYHPPQPGDPAKYQAIRNAGKLSATVAMKSAPQSPELMLALRKLEEFCFWANAAVARHPGKPPAEAPPAQQELALIPELPPGPIDAFDQQ